jgi:hypothetical protein
MKKSLKCSFAKKFPYKDFGARKQNSSGKSATPLRTMTMMFSKQFRTTFLTGTVAAITLCLSAPPVIAVETAVPIALTKTVVQPNSAKVAAIPGSQGLRISFEKTDWPSLWFRQGTAYPSLDWSAYAGVALTVRNPDPKEKLQFHVRVDDSPLADGQKHCKTGFTILAPGETATVVFALSGGTVTGMRAGPPATSDASARVMDVYGSELNEKNIIGFQIFLGQPPRPRDLDILAVRFLPKPDMVGIVDKWGQYSKADWPGKIHSDAELAKATADEKTWLAANPPMPDHDSYGGWKTGPTLKATGFFRTALVAGGKELIPPKPGEPLPAAARWWLVTPEGHLFWSAGVDCVRPYAEAPLTGKEAMYTDLPPGARERKQADFLQANIQRRYTGDDWLKRWTDETVIRMQSLGFNTIANWSESAAYRARRVPYVVPLGVGSGLPEIAPSDPNDPAARGRLPDYFDTRFPDLVRDALTKGTAEWKNDPWCLGYFIDNELAWDSWAQYGTGGGYVVARNALASPATQPARLAFVRLLQAKYPTASAWGKAWGITVTDWNTPVALKAAALNTAAKQDCAAFSTALAERYFSVIHDAFKIAAPNQLYLGCRFAIRPPEMVTVAARYCDVVSFNIYADTVDSQTWGFTEKLGKPVIIGEYHFGATDRGMFHPGLRPRKDQADRAAAYEGYVRSVRALPAFVGCHWFQWADEPLTGRFDGENYNIGFVTTANTLYPEMRDAARRVNSTLYGPVP